MRDTNVLGKILVADDEETFLDSTADLLRKEGYECDCASDGSKARSLLEQNRYDLLIADIKMPGNAELELIRDLPEVARGMPAILATGYPSLSTAIDSVQLSVIAYLVKPIDFDEMHDAVQRAIGLSRTYQTVLDARERNRNTLASIESVEDTLHALSGREVGAPVHSFIDTTLSSILEGLRDLKRLTDEGVLELNPCATEMRATEERLATVKGALADAVMTLEKTRSSFKSKTIGALRQRLETVLGEL